MYLRNVSTNSSYFKSGSLSLGFLLDFYLLSSLQVLQNTYLLIADDLKILEWKIDYSLRDIVVEIVTFYNHLNVVRDTVFHP